MSLYRYRLEFSAMLGDCVPYRVSKLTELVKAQVAVANEAIKRNGFTMIGDVVKVNTTKAPERSAFQTLRKVMAVKEPTESELSEISIATGASIKTLRAYMPRIRKGHVKAHS